MSDLVAKMVARIISENLYGKEQGKNQMKQISKTN